MTRHDLRVLTGGRDERPPVPSTAHITDRFHAPAGSLRDIDVALAIESQLRHYIESWETERDNLWMNEARFGTADDAVVRAHEARFGRAMRYVRHLLIDIGAPDVPGRLGGVHAAIVDLQLARDDTRFRAVDAFAETEPDLALQLARAVPDWPVTLEQRCARLEKLIQAMDMLYCALWAMRSGGPLSPAYYRYVSLPSTWTLPSEDAP